MPSNPSPNNPSHSYRAKVVFTSAVVLFVSALLLTLITITLLYQVAFDQARERLEVTAKSQARIIDAIARLNIRHHQEHSLPYESNGLLQDTLTAVRDAHNQYQYEGFGATGEFALGRRQGDYIQ